MKKKTLEIVYEKYSQEVYLYAFSLCKDHYLAQDLVSDTFFKALLSIKDDNIEIKYWLFRVCKNLWLDNIKYRKRFSNNPLDTFQLPIEDNILSKLIIAEERRKLYVAILALPPSSMEVVMLFYFCNMSLKDIAENLNMNPGAVRTLLFRARQKLKTLLEEE
ncbi:MAG: sigma-70 family RNA polymerase sigma factor [Clostridium sp.]